MSIAVRPSSLPSIKHLRDEFRREAGCQIVHDSFLPRGLADIFALFLDDRLVGYGAVSNRYDPGRVVAFYLDPDARGSLDEVARRFIEVSGASEIEAQTNLPLMKRLLDGWGVNPVCEKLLFDAGVTTQLECTCGTVRERADADTGPEGEWVLDVDGRVVAAGGVLTHYNPPYEDVYMEVVEGERRNGYGSYFVQELKRLCVDRGGIPAARCNPDNIASRRTLEKAGMTVCGRLLVGAVKTG